MSGPASVSRAATLAALGADSLDLLVIGGGIVGSGIARDAAMRGLSVAVVDRHDFAFGTSSRSSRLLHGGMRYLAQGRLGLVREASVEKRIVHGIAPHLAAPLAFVFPTYKGTGWPLWQLRIGVKVYDLLCSGKNFGPSSGHGAAAALQLVPQLNPARLAGAVRYFDGLTNDARLVLDTLRSAVRAGAQASNYTGFVSAARVGAGWEATLLDRETSRQFTARCGAIINATGPWADGLQHSGVRLRCTKGVHLVVDRARLPVTDAIALTEGKRILFVIPWGLRVIIGTTDTDYSGKPEHVAVEQADIDYLLASVNGLFPTLGLAEADIISSWAGVRPLLEDPDGRPSDISRSHQIVQPEPGWWDVSGGKLTTYRLMAEQTVDRVVRELGVAAGPCRTASEPLLPADAVGPSGLLPPEFRREWVEHFCREEWALHLRDVMDRRTSWGHYHRDATEMAREVNSWMAEALGWTGAVAEAEWKAYLGNTASTHGTDT